MIAKIERPVHISPWVPIHAADFYRTIWEFAVGKKAVDQQAVEDFHGWLNSINSNPPRLLKDPDYKELVDRLVEAVESVRQGITSKEKCCQVAFRELQIAFPKRNSDGSVRLGFRRDEI